MAWYCRGMSNTPLVAIDVALLPPEDIALAARTMSAALRADQPGGFALDETHLPHITLVQLFVRRRDLPAVYSAIDTVLAGFGSLALIIPEVGVVSEGPSLDISFFVVEPTPDLRRLHEELVAQLRVFAQYPGSEQAFLRDPGERVRPGSVAYTNAFMKQYAGANYQPHITLGVGATTDSGAPLTGTASVVAVCHLGNFNTCRKVLHSWVLGS